MKRSFWSVTPYLHNGTNGAADILESKCEGHAQHISVAHSIQVLHHVSHKEHVKPVNIPQTYT